MLQSSFETEEQDNTHIFDLEKVKFVYNEVDVETYDRKFLAV